MKDVELKEKIPEILGDGEINWETLGALKAKQYLVRTMKLIQEPHAPSEINDRLDVELETAANYIRELRYYGLVENKTPSRHKFILYQLNEKGKEILEKIEDTEL